MSIVHAVRINENQYGLQFFLFLSWPCTHPAPVLCRRLKRPLVYLYLNGPYSPHYCQCVLDVVLLGTTVCGVATSMRMIPTFSCLLVREVSDSDLKNGQAFGIKHLYAKTTNIQISRSCRGSTLGYPNRRMMYTTFLLFQESKFFCMIRTWI